MCYIYGRIFIIVREKNGDIINNFNVLREGLVNKKVVVIIGIIVCFFIVIFMLSVVVYFLFLFEDDVCMEYEFNNLWLWVVLVLFYYFVFNLWVYGFRYGEL